jgi:flagellar biosynthesis/type III secretory pathway protein FliH
VVPPEAVDAEDRETTMDIQAWYAEFQQQTIQAAVQKQVQEALQKAVQEAVQEAVQKGHDEGLRDGLVEGQLQTTAKLFEKRLGRSLDEAERKTLAERLGRLGLDRVDDVVLSLSADAVARWLTDPSAP